MSGSVAVGRDFPVGRARRAHSRGMVTVEIAFGALAAALAAGALAWVLTLVMLLARCQDLAGAVARQEARSDTAAVAKLVAERPEGSQVRVRQQSDVIMVTVDMQAHPWAQWLPGVALSASSTAIREPLS